MVKNETIISAKDVKKTYDLGAVKVHALDGITVDVYRGEYLCVMGPSGSGKSTFFNMVGGLDTPTEGIMEIEGMNITNMNKEQLAWLRCNKVGYIFQSFNLIDVLTAIENVMLPMTFSGIADSEAEDRAAETLKSVGLGHRLTHLPGEVSGGQQQRIAIARALANRPSILLADEPTGNLDLVTGEEIITLLKTMSQEMNTTVIAVTHDLKMYHVSDRIVWIRDGKIERIAKRDEVEVNVGGISGAAAERLGKMEHT